MSNPAMPGLLKIGRSSKEPKGDRAAELSKATGVPQPFEVEYQALVDDESREEKRLHKHFQSKRVNGKEFFEGLTVSEVIEATHSLCTIKYEDNFHQTKADQAKFEEERKRQRERRKKQAEDDLRRRREQEEQEQLRQEREKEKLERQRKEARLKEEELERFRQHATDLQREAQAKERREFFSILAKESIGWVKVLATAMAATGSIILIGSTLGPTWFAVILFIVVWGGLIFMLGRILLPFLKDLRDKFRKGRGG